MTKLEIINETAEYYGEDPSRRGVDQFGCSYLTPDGKECAVGRCLIDPSQCESSMPIRDILPVWGEEIFKEEYRGHSVDFWEFLQAWHDCRENFTDTGISEVGQQAIEAIKQRWS